MKKFLIILVIFIAFFSAGCGNINEENVNNNSLPLSFDLDSILVVENEQMSEFEGLDYKKFISDKAQYFLVDNIQKNYSKTISNVKCELKYKDSIYYPIGCNTVHRYIVNGNEENTLLLDEYGNIKSILYSFTTLSINRSASPKEILEPLKNELVKIFDITYYENVRMSDEKDTVNGFGIYDYLFFNKIGNYITDYLKVSVKDDGSVFGLFIINLTPDDYKLKIDTEKEHSAIESKLKEIYNTDTTQYKSYNMVLDPLIVQYNDSMYIQYTISTNYLHMQYGERSSFAHYILIPVGAISL